MERKEKIKKMIKENPDKGKCKNVTDALVKHANHLPLSLRKIKNTEDGIQKIQEGILSLTTRPPKIIKKKDLALLYIKGFQRQPIKDLKDSLCNIGIKRFDIRNISFIGNDICELTVLKKSKPIIIEILK
eukprot:jgi/Orpsp1_1/1191946/evm.model.d7180000089553.1